MRIRRRRSRSWNFSAGALGVFALLSSATAGCGNVTALDSPASSTPSPSLSTSIQSATGAWAVVPMGNLSQPLNTFWQLLHRPTGAARWEDEAPSLAVATNGGLVVALDGNHALAVGIRPANLLAFSPLLIDGGTESAWTPAAPLAALENHPDVLAIGTDGRSVAISRVHGTEAVLVSSAGLAAWRVLTSATSLGASPVGRSCEISSLTAVGLVGTSTVVGASCSRGGVVGIVTGSPAPLAARWPSAPRVASPRPGHRARTSGHDRRAAGAAFRHRRSAHLVDRRVDDRTGGYLAIVSRAVDWLSTRRLVRPGWTRGSLRAHVESRRIRVP